MITPRLPRYVGGDIKTYLDDLVVQLERQLTRGPSGRPYVVTATSPARFLDASTASASDVARVVTTLINDLKAGSVVA